MIEAIIFGLYTLTIFGLVYLIIRLNIKIKQLTFSYIQSEFDKHLIKQELERISKENSNRELLESDGFIKFISQSRDWAFEYIEQVQEALSEFDEILSPILDYNNKFGIVLGINDKTYVKLNEISVAYEKLKKVLPENTETPNN